MINDSKKNDSRFLAKWRASGAIGTIDDAIFRDLGTEIFEKTPLRYELGLPVYSLAELGDLAHKEFKTRIVQRGVWANNPKYSNMKTAKAANKNPTYIIYFSETSDGNYRFDVKPTA
ncbi:MAG: hypothetical protein Q8O89_06720 [Nanoarchaeota archaeon]|nr:hypothetical protein [Nanoarchaeota archaeon]